MHRVWNRLKPNPFPWFRVYTAILFQFNLLISAPTSVSIWKSASWEQQNSCCAQLGQQIHRTLGSLGPAVATTHGLPKPYRTCAEWFAEVRISQVSSCQGTEKWWQNWVIGFQEWRHVFTWLSLNMTMNRSIQFLHTYALHAKMLLLKVTSKHIKWTNHLTRDGLPASCAKGPPRNPMALWAKSFKLGALMCTPILERFRLVLRNHV